MKVHRYQSYKEYERAHTSATISKSGGGRTAVQHGRYINQFLAVIRVRGGGMNPQTAGVCMRVRSGLELLIWEWKGFKNVVGMELAPVSIHPKVLQADFAQLGDLFGEDCVDFVYSCHSFEHSFEHSFDPEETGREWLRILKPTGWLWISVPTSIGVGLKSPSESDPVLISAISDLEKLFSPMKVVWSAVEVGGPGSSGTSVLNLNAVMSFEVDLPTTPGTAVLRHTRRAIRRGRCLLWLVDKLDAVGSRQIGRAHV